MGNWKRMLGWSLPVLLLAACSQEGSDPFQGYVEGEYLYLAAPSGGYLATLDAARGTRVKAGAAVFSLATDPDLQGLQEAEARADSAKAKLRNLNDPRRPTEIAALEAQVQAAEAVLRLSETQRVQQEALAAKGFIAQSRLDEVRAAVARDRATVQSQREQLATARASLGRQPELSGALADEAAAKALAAQKRWQMEKKAMTAPATGEVVETYYRPGEWVPAGQPVASLLPDERRKLRFFVPETVVGSLKMGQAVEVGCDGCKASIRATINFIAAQAEYTPPVIYSKGAREKLVFRVEAQPAAEDAVTLRPGLPVDVRLVR